MQRQDHESKTILARSATAQQLAKIDQLIIENNELIKQKFRFLTIAITLGLPTLFSRIFLAKDELLYPLIAKLQTYFNNYYIALGTAHGAKVSEAKQGLYEIIVDIVNKFPDIDPKEPKIELPFDPKTMTASLVKKIFYQAEALDVKHVAYSVYETIGKKFADILHCTIINKSHSKLTSLVIDVNGQKGLKLQSLNFKTWVEYADFLKFAIEDFNSLLNEDRIKKDISLHSEFRSTLAVNSSIFGFSIISGSLIQLFAVEPALGLINKAILNHYHIADQNTYLSESEAEDYIITLKEKNLQDSNAAARNVFIMHIATMMAVFYVYDQWLRGKEDSVAATFVFSGLLAFFNDLVKYFKALYRKDIQKENGKIQESLNRTTFKIVRYVWTLEDKFLYIKPGTYRGLSERIVLGAIKDAMIKYKVDIIRYDDVSITVNKKLLDHGHADQINQQIRNHLERLLNIRLLKVQLKTLFNEFLEEDNIQISGSDGLPRQKFVITAPSAQSLQAVYDVLKTVFAVADLKMDNDFLWLTADVLSTAQMYDIKEKIAACYIKPKTMEDAEISLPVLKTSIIEEPIPERKSEKKKTVKESKREIVVETKASSRVIRWNSGAVYDPNDVNCEVKRLNHPIFGRDSFVLFKIPAERFPNEASCKHMKDKVLEGRFAKSEKGSQGLQFRSERHIDQTLPGRQFMQSTLRIKLLKGLGNARGYADEETNGEYKLFTFKSVNMSAH